MASKQLPSLNSLNKSLKTLLKKYELFDIIVFGSYVKSKDYPKDIDIAVLSEGKVDELTKFRNEISKKIKHKISLEFLDTKSIYTNPLWPSLQREGYSIKKGKFLNELLGLNPYVIYTYELKNLVAWKKVNFSKALNMFLKKYKGQKLGRGAVMVPRKHSGFFEEFFNTWDLKYQVKWIDLIA